MVVVFTATRDTATPPAEVEYFSFFFYLNQILAIFRLTDNNLTLDEENVFVRISIHHVVSGLLKAAILKMNRIHRGVMERIS